MDKKNTMLLTVIAIATLLVAVIGATFAYFGVTGSATNATSAAINSTTDQVGTVSIASTANTELHIDTTANDFRNPGNGNSMTYFAKAGASSPVRSDYETSETPIAMYTLTATGATTVYYKCDVTVQAATTISARNSGNETTALEANEYYIKLTADGSTSSATTDWINVVTSPTASNATVTKVFSIYLNSATARNITATAKLVNTDQEQQDHLSNAGINTAISITNFVCDTASNAANTVA